MKLIDRIDQLFNLLTCRYVETPGELEAHLPGAVNQAGPGIFHIRISGRANRKKQEFGFDPTGERAKRIAARKAKSAENARLVDRVTRLESGR